MIDGLLDLKLFMNLGMLIKKYNRKLCKALECQVENKDFISLEIMIIVQKIQKNGNPYSKR